LASSTGFHDKLISKLKISIGCAAMDQDTLHWIIELGINEGKQSEFEKLAKEMSDMVRRSEPGTRKYEWFLSENGNKCLVIETYDSSDSGLVHVRGEAINKIFPEILKVAKITRFEICGKPSKELVDELADDNVGLYRFIAGFSRQ
jgi:quinol monooxygenase YgiN